MIEYLLKACEVCASNAVVGPLRNIIFRDGRLTAFDGVVQYQAPSTIDPAETFQVSHEKLAQALRACGEGISIQTTDLFLMLKQGPLRVRVRKINDAPTLDRISLPPSAAEQKALDLLLALRKVRDFISSDASRPWSVSALIRDGYVYATNNLALVRSPVSLKIEATIPRDAVHFLCSFPSLDYYHVDEQGRLIFASGRQLIRCPQSAASWPDLSAFFAKLPAEMPEIPVSMKDAASTVARFADRHVGLDALKVESKTAQIETEYEVEFSKGAGLYNARLLSLILEHATHADFSYYPAPIFFRGDAIEGTAVGVKQ